ncbi:hypothetical protein [Amphibacillus sediminis]|uniref:hypothetical protein n=1 Tax=Amphibacillus sediminis TaxID=360185 RepID=UPI000834C14D|nr:hypothetical protein [Amphibacillus sediminis]
MGETIDGEQVGQRFSERDRQQALECLNTFKQDKFDYYVIYQKDNQKTIREFHFNQVNVLDNGQYLVAMHHEDMHDFVCYYNGESVTLLPDEVLKVRIVNPDEYDFVVYTD